MQKPKSIPRRTAPKPKAPARCVDVVDAFPLSPNMQRVALSGEELLGFPPNRDGANLKIMIPRPRQNREDFKSSLQTATGERIVRTFTISGYDERKNLLVIDFALHDGAAPAGDWAKAAGPGAFLGVTNGGAVKVTEFWGRGGCSGKAGGFAD